jgi:hypothetical protein
VSSVRFRKPAVLPAANKLRTADIRCRTPGSGAEIAPLTRMGESNDASFEYPQRFTIRFSERSNASRKRNRRRLANDLKPTFGLNQANRETSLLVSWKETSMLRVLLAATLLIASATVSFGGETKCNGQYGCPTNGSPPPAPKQVCHADPKCPPGRTCLTICESPR